MMFSLILVSQWVRKPCWMTGYNFSDSSASGTAISIVSFLVLNGFLQCLENGYGGMDPKHLKLHIVREDWKTYHDLLKSATAE